MHDFLHEAFAKDLDLPLRQLVTQVAVAFGLGCVVAGIYRLTTGRGGSQKAGVMGTLVLLSVLVAMVTLVVGNNPARAFSLVGVLAIVRFRTVVEDARDTAFVIFAVAVGQAAGAGFLMIPLVGIPFAALAAFLFRSRNGSALDLPLPFTLTVRVGNGHSADTLLREAFTRHLEQSRLTATVTARQGAALDLTYAVRLRAEEAAVALVTELNRLDGIQNVELRQT
jgi:uncharacterized membrane protein YhiD involved in acid resistance